MAKIEVVQNNTKTTSLTDLKRYAKGAVVELPPFAQDMPLFAKLKRPSLIMMVADGMVPNPLMATAESMFMNGINDSNVTMQEMRDVLVCMCKACMIEPTYQDIQEAGLELTDEQMIFIFNYSQIGVNALRSFRSE